MFFVVAGYSLFDTFKVENIGSFKKVIYSVFGLPLVLIVSYIIIQIINWVSSDLIANLFDNYINTIASDFVLTFWIVSNFGLIMTIYGVLWTLAVIFNFQTISDRYKYFMGDNK